jgi:hypothetical protein
MPTLREQIAANLAAGLRARQPVRSEELFLSGPGRSYNQLLAPTGEPTAAGRIYEELTGERLPAGGFDPNQQPTRSGNAKYIRTGAVARRGWSGDGTLPRTLGCTTP